MLITEKSKPEDKEKVVADLIKLLIKNHMFADVNIYCNNKCWKSDDPSEKHDAIISNDFAKPVYIVDGIKAKDYIEFANEKLITMSFEGPLYRAMNYYTYDNCRFEKKLMDFFDKYGLYYELGYAWSLSVYEK